MWGAPYPEDEEEQTHGQQLPNEEDGPENQESEISQLALKISLVWDVVPVVVEVLESAGLAEEQDCEVVTGSGGEEEDDHSSHSRRPTHAGALAEEVRAGAVRVSGQQHQDHGQQHCVHHEQTVIDHNPDQDQSPSLSCGPGTVCESRTNHIHREEEEGEEEEEQAHQA